MAEWVEYSTSANGDVSFFDDERVSRTGDLVKVWSRVRYKTSVMGASSYQRLLEIDCSAYSETTLQSTFYIDGDWSTPAMATNTRAKPTVAIEENSATALLANMLCR